jgi:hypothetical protein
MKLLVFGTIAGVAAQSLCGNWAQVANSGTKCSNTNQCCEQTTDAIPRCNLPLVADQSSIITQEDYQFAGDLQYSITLRIATGQGCPLSDTSGSVLFQVQTEGTYSREGNNTEVGGWEKVKYTPKRFVTTIVKNNQPSPFTDGVASKALFLSPCVLMTTYLNDAVVGCPCNQTWTASGVPRTIEVSKCPMRNSTNGTMVSSCPESYFFNTANKYGNIRITNHTSPDGNSTTRMLDITQPNLNSTLGYGNPTLYASFSADFSCPSSIDSTNTTAPTPAPSGALIFTPSVFAVWLYLLTL